jgi:hypothetical protein
MAKAETFDGGSSEYVIVNWRFAGIEATGKIACPAYGVLGGSASVIDIAPADAAGVAMLVVVNAAWLGSVGALDEAAGTLVLASGLPLQPGRHAASTATPRPADAIARSLRTIDLDGRDAAAYQKSSVHPIVSNEAQTASTMPTQSLLCIPSVVAQRGAGVNCQRLEKSNVP